MKVKPKGNSGEVVLEVTRRDEPLLSAAATVPFRIKQILVPTDFSECSRKALQYALPMAEQNQSTVTLLYVVPTPTYVAGEYGSIEYTALEADMRSGGDQRLADFVKNEIRSKVPVETAVRTGSASNEIVEAAKSIPADIIVISTHGYSGFKHVLLGSVAEHVVRHAPCPVLVVREREHEFLTT